MELKDTVDMMLSDNYKDRFKAEFHQLDIRYSRLNNMLELWDKGKLDFTPICARSIYEKQLRAMADYRDVLMLRAHIEGIELYE